MPESLGRVSHAAHYPQLGVQSSKFLIYCSGSHLSLLSSVPYFPPFVFGAWRHWWHVLLNDVALTSSAHIITGFTCTISAEATIVWGIFGKIRFSPEFRFGLERIWTWIDSRFRSGCRHTPPSGSPSPWRSIACILWVSVLFYAICHLWPIHIRV